MAAKTFTNTGGQSSIQVEGSETVVVSPGETVTTDKEELKTALRKSGFTEGAKKVNVSSYRYKDAD